MEIKSSVLVDTAHVCYYYSMSDLEISRICGFYHNFCNSPIEQNLKKTGNQCN